MNLLVCGVGGQGVILFSDILSGIALSAGLDVKKSEVHGMAQRGGSVSTHIRYGRKVYSPLIEEGTADLLVSFERLETLRYAHYLGPEGRFVYDLYRLDPLPVQSGAVERPTDQYIDERIAARARHVTAVAAHETACRLGNSRVQNVLMLGVVSCFLEFPVKACRDVIQQMVRPEFVDINLRAFSEGRGLAGGR